jgi:hypothetical protein
MAHAGAVPNAAAFTFPCASMVVISTRHELGAKMLSHHSGLTSIFFASEVTIGTRSSYVSIS